MTKSMEQCKEDLKNDIEKSGFLLEITASIVLKRHGWAVAPHVIYPSEQKEGYAESDIRAHKTHPNVKNKIYDVLVIECKKQQSSPWVFFEQDEPNMDIFTLNVTPSSRYEPLKDYWEKHYYFKKVPCVYHFPHFAHKGDNASADKNRKAHRKTSDPILDGITSVLDALDFFMKQENEYISFGQSHRVCVFHPVVVLDGPMLSAEIKPDGTINILDQKSLQLKVTKAIPPTKFFSADRQVIKTQKDYVIDFVTKGQFEQFMENFS